MRLLIPICFVAIAGLSLQASEPPIKITLGIREGKLVTITDTTLPLAFRIENTGTEAIKEDEIPALFFKGVVHVLNKDGKEQQTNFQKIWRTMIYDLQPGATFESPVVGSILTFFPSLKDGEYQVWWTLGDFKSNPLNFTATNGKVSMDGPKT